MTFSSAAEKHRYVNQMFARIAHRYDLMNRVMTAGQDSQWRQFLIQQAALPSHGRLLDIATGTGDIAFEALKQHPDLAQVVGADFTLPMMRVGQGRWQSLQPSLNGRGVSRGLRGAFIAGNFLSHTVSWWNLTPTGSTVRATAPLGSPPRPYNEPLQLTARGESTLLPGVARHFTANLVPLNGAWVLPVGTGTYTVTFSAPSHRSVRRIDVNVSAARVTEQVQVTLGR